MLNIIKFILVDLTVAYKIQFIKGIRETIKKSEFKLSIFLNYIIEYYQIIGRQKILIQPVAIREK